jgi:hypothetical protein
MAGKIGPHNEVELELMLLGSKPAALVERWEYSRWKPFVDAGVFIAKPFHITCGGKPHERAYAVAQAGMQWRMEQVAKEFSRNYRDHVRIGFLLGYDKEDIRLFITRKNAGHSVRFSTGCRRPVESL